MKKRILTASLFSTLAFAPFFGAEASDMALSTASSEIYQCANISSQNTAQGKVVAANQNIMKLAQAEDEEGADGTSEASSSSWDESGSRVDQDDSDQNDVSGGLDGSNTAGQMDGSNKAGANQAANGMDGSNTGESQGQEGGGGAGGGGGSYETGGVYGGSGGTYQ